MDTRISAAAINNFILKTGIEKCLGVGNPTLSIMLQTYVDVYIDLDENFFVNDTEPDDPQPLIDVLLKTDSMPNRPIDFLLFGSKYLRILSRKGTNYRFFGSNSLVLLNYLFSLKKYFSQFRGLPRSQSDFFPSPISEDCFS